MNPLTADTVGSHDDKTMTTALLGGQAITGGSTHGHLLYRQSATARHEGTLQ